MATLFINPNSIYNTSEANFILNKDALYAFTASVSTLNESLYGMQPSRAQLLSGFTLSDVYAVNPISSNFSICADVDRLQNTFVKLSDDSETLKYFSTRTFVVCESVEDRNEKAKNPLAVYLTPIGEPTQLSDSSFFEWFYVLSGEEGKDELDWEYLQSVVLSAKTSPEFRLSSLPGFWELIGTTSMTDEKFAQVIQEVNGRIELSADSLKEKIDLLDESVVHLSGEETLSGDLFKSVFSSGVENPLWKRHVYKTQADEYFCTEADAGGIFSEFEAFLIEPKSLQDYQSLKLFSIYPEEGAPELTAQNPLSAIYVDDSYNAIEFNGGSWIADGEDDYCRIEYNWHAQSIGDFNVVLEVRGTPDEGYEHVSSIWEYPLNETWALLQKSDPGIEVQLSNGQYATAFLGFNFRFSSAYDSEMREFATLNDVYLATIYDNDNCYEENEFLIEPSEKADRFALVEKDVAPVENSLNELSSKALTAESDPVFSKWKTSEDIVAGYNSYIDRYTSGQDYNKVAIYGSNIEVSGWEGVTTYVDPAGVFIGDKIHSDPAFGGQGTFKAKGNIAIGRSINLSGQNIIALGDGEDGYGHGSTDINDKDAFYVWDKKMLDKTTGKIPVERIPDIPEARVSAIGYIKSADASQIARGIVSEVSALLETSADHKEDMRLLTETISAVSTDLSNAISSEAERALSGETSALTSAKQYTDEKLSALTGYLPLSGGTLSAGTNFAIIGNDGQKTYLSVTEDSTMFGYNTAPSFPGSDNTYSTALGANAKATHNSVAVGESAQANGENSTVLGQNSRTLVGGISSIAVGTDIQIESSESIVVGNQFISRYPSQVVIGNRNYSQDVGTPKERAVIVGTDNAIGGKESIAVGAGNLVRADGAIAIGLSSNIREDGAIMLGTGYIAEGTSNVSSFWVNSYKMLDKNGNIPEERVSAIGYIKEASVTGNYLPLSGGELTGPVSSTSTFAASSVSATALSGGTLYFQDGTSISSGDFSNFVSKSKIKDCLDSTLSNLQPFDYDNGGGYIVSVIFHNVGCLVSAFMAISAYCS